MATKTLIFPRDIVFLDHASHLHYNEKHLKIGNNKEVGSDKGFDKGFISGYRFIELPDPYKSWGAIRDHLYEENQKKFEWLILPRDIFRLSSIADIHNKIEDNCIVVHFADSNILPVTVYGSFAIYNSPGPLCRTPYSIFFPNMTALYDYAITQVIKSYG